MRHTPGVGRDADLHRELEAVVELGVPQEVEVKVEPFQVAQQRVGHVPQQDPSPRTDQPAKSGPGAWSGQ